MDSLAELSNRIMDCEDPAELDRLAKQLNQGMRQAGVTSNVATDDAGEPLASHLSRKMN